MDNDDLRPLTASDKLLIAFVSIATAGAWCALIAIVVAIARGYE